MRCAAFFLLEILTSLVQRGSNKFVSFFRNETSKMKRPTALASLLSLSLLSVGAASSDIDHGKW